MLKEAMEFIANLNTQASRTEIVDIGGISYNKRPGGVLDRIKNPGIQAAERLHTLSGLVDLLNGDVDEETLRVKGPNCGWLIHVNTPTQVAVMSSLGRTNPGERDVYALAEIKHEYFRFGQFMDQESFVIGMLSCFAATDDWSTVMQLVGNLRGEKVRTDEDDGFTQVAAVKKGAKMAPTEVKNPVTLRPHRTFYDVLQPSGQYVLRLQQAEQEVPMVALFEVRDGHWQHEAMESIRDYFAGHCPAYMVVC